MQINIFRIAVSVISFVFVGNSNLAFANQGKYQSNKETRWSVQRNANALTDSDIVLLNRAALEIYPNNGTITSPTVVVTPPDMNELQRWLNALPPSQAKPIMQQLSNAAPASAMKIIGQPFSKRLTEIADTMRARGTFCRLSDGLAPIGFDGQYYTFPVGIFTDIGYEHANLYMHQSGKQFRNTPANLVSDGEYNKIKSFTTNPRYVFKVCWKDAPGHFASQETIQKRSVGYMLPGDYAVDIVGSFEIWDTETGKSAFIFPNKWFFY